MRSRFQKLNLGQRCDRTTRLFFALGLAASMLPAAKAEDRRAREVIVVAERSAHGVWLSRPNPAHPVYYLAYDAGYLELGNSIAGLAPPAAPVVARALKTALAHEDYQVAPTGVTPSLVLVYHWGSDRSSPRNRFHWEGKLDLAPGVMAPLTEEVPVEGIPPSELSRTSWNVIPDPRYFLVVSAYDYADLVRQKTTLLWRANLSASDRSGTMDEILPALAAGSGPFFAQGFDSRKSSAATRLARKDDEGSRPAKDEPVTPPADPELFDRLMQHVREFFPGDPSGLKTTEWSALPPAIKQRITAYQQEKTALQKLLAEKIKTQPPGPETHRTIEQFKVDNAGRIAALGRMEENIRGDLAGLNPANPSGVNQPLDALLQEFATGVHELKRPVIDAVVRP